METRRVSKGAMETRRVSKGPRAKASNGNPLREQGTASESEQWKPAA